MTRRRPRAAGPPRAHNGGHSGPDRTPDAVPNRRETAARRGPRMTLDVSPIRDSQLRANREALITRRAPT